MFTGNKQDRKDQTAEELKSSTSCPLALVVLMLSGTRAISCESCVSRNQSRKTILPISTTGAIYELASEEMLFHSFRFVLSPLSPSDPKSCLRSLETSLLSISLRQFARPLLPPRPPTPSPHRVLSLSSDIKYLSRQVEN